MLIKAFKWLIQNLLNAYSNSKFCATHNFNKMILTTTKLSCHILPQLAFFSALMAGPPGSVNQTVDSQPLINPLPYGVSPHCLTKSFSPQRTNDCLSATSEAHTHIQSLIVLSLWAAFNTTVCEILPSLGFPLTSPGPFFLVFSGKTFCLPKEVIFGNPSLPSLAALPEKPCALHLCPVMIPKVLSSALSSILNSRLVYTGWGKRRFTVVSA